MYLSNHFAALPVEMSDVSHTRRPDDEEPPMTKTCDAVSDAWKQLVDAQLRHDAGQAARAFAELVRLHQLPSPLQPSS